ncbi:hypothetical protein LV84_01761 [Algoriphagus ratkowskyi]|uniref:Uncharacterized protein n=1 Tax=Algoriphagus ratkowskyi TaxID=57028 RepID=A0A2W7T349_9BACT|nr:hypothetical protein [Algoriphagus ratkowskyi]PZX57632.1 hypothetical protein LV84_01761 [Algoriphagus ratkowskyi]TXD78903.1 hypothetical protein ESW18_05140 [Algoriphagus ratkowskyi]
MIIQTATANFLIEMSEPNSGCVLVRSNSQEELHRFFGSLEISLSNDLYYAFEVRSCKQEFANALILMVKEIDYSQFTEFNLHMS